MILFNQVNSKDIVDLSFNIRNGEFAFIYHKDPDVLLQLQQLLLGKIKPEKGYIRWLSEFEQNFNLIKRDIGIVYHEDYFLPDRTLEDNFLFIMKAIGMNHSYFKVRIKKVLCFSSLEKYSQNKPGELPDYILSRAKIAAAILHYPGLLILNNPTDRIDELNSQGIIHLLKKINQESATIFLLSSDHKLVLDKQIRKIEVNYVPVKKKKGSYA